MRDLMEAKMELVLKKLETSTTCTSKKLNQIEKSLAFMRGTHKMPLDHTDDE